MPHSDIEIPDWIPLCVQQEMVPFPYMVFPFYVNDRALAPFTEADHYDKLVAVALRLPAEKVRVITPYVGGGFGGKSASRQAVEAARLAMLTGKPVRVIFTREEEFFYDTFRPASVIKIASGLDASGKIVTWQYWVHAAGERGAAHFYDIPHHRTLAYGTWSGAGTPGYHPFAVGPWRAPGARRPGAST